MAPSSHRWNASCRARASEALEDQVVEFFIMDLAASHVDIAIRICGTFPQRQGFEG